MNFVAVPVMGCIPANRNSASAGNNTERAWRLP